MYPLHKTTYLEKIILRQMLWYLDGFVIISRWEVLVNSSHVVVVWLFTRNMRYYAVMGNWIHGFTNWIGFNSQMNPDESTGSAGRVEFELSWALWKAVMMNLTWVLTQSTWIPSESESIIFKKESKNRLNVTITIHFLSQGRAYGNSQLDIMKEAVAGSFCISMSIV